VTEAPPDTLDFAEVLRSLLRGWRWIGATFVLAALATTTVLSLMPVRFQSTLELRLTVAREPLLATVGLQLGANDVIPLLLGSETRRAAAASASSPAVADETRWTADQVTAVGNGQDTVFVLVRDEDPDLAAATANAVEAAARQVREARLEQGLREALVPLEREREDLLSGLEEVEVDTGRTRPVEGSLDETLDRLRLESTLERIVALETQMARIRSLIAAPPPDWRVVEKASPGQHALRDQNPAEPLAAVLVPTLLAAIVWLIHDGRPRRS
jgi:uncharacterized protein involved in exopolysaccharide biosynthesis